MHDKGGQPLGHRMRFNAYNRVLDDKIGEIDQERVSHVAGFEGTMPSDGKRGRNRTNLCDRSRDRASLCEGGPGAPVGALLPDGKRFDLDLPFHYPFTKISRSGSEGRRTLAKTSRCSGIGTWRHFAFRCAAEFGRYRGSQTTAIELDYEYAP